jgi:hypothetical protein
MARRFAAVGSIAAVSSSFKTPLDLTSTALVRPKIYSFVLSTLGAAADGVLEWILQRATAAATATTQTPRNLDPTDPGVAITIPHTLTTVESATITANSSVFDQGINQRATYTWTSWTEGAQIVLPAIATNLMLFSCLSSVAPAYTGVANAQAYFEE